MKTLLFFFSFIFIQLTHSQSQRNVERSKKELGGTLVQQFNILLEKGGNYSTDSIPFEVIKKRYLIAFKEHLKDSLQSQSLVVKRVKENNAELININKQLKSEVQKISEAQNTLRKYAETISFLGLPLNKKLFLWIFGIILLFLAAIISYLGKDFIHNRQIKEVLNSEKIAAEKALETFRKSAISREQKLSRKILDLEKQITKSNI